MTGRKTCRLPSAPLGATVLLLLTLGACAAPPQTAAPPAPPPARTAEYLSAAQDALEAGRIEDAGHRFARVLAADPDNREARLGMAETHLARGQAREALALFDSLTKDPVMRPLALQGRGLALLALGRTGPAETALREASGTLSLWRTWNALGRIADMGMRWDEADTCYAAAMKANPRAAEIPNNQGYSLLLRGRHREAEEQFRAALALDPSLRAAASNLRLALAWQGRYAEAVAGTRREDLPPVLNDIGAVAMVRGETETAEAYFVRALAASPRHMPEADRNLTALRAARAPR